MPVPVRLVRGQIVRLLLRASTTTHSVVGSLTDLLPDTLTVHVAARGRAIPFPVNSVISVEVSPDGRAG